MSTYNRAQSWLLGMVLTASMSGAGAATSARESTQLDPQLVALTASPQRTPTELARDRARHPAEELTFFGLKPSMTVVELWPAPGYWTEILGPYLAAHGHYYVAHQVPGDKEEDEGVARWHERVTKQKDRFGSITETLLGKDHFDIAPAGSADLVLTFRNLHNWMSGGYVDDALAAAYRALKPGGILGIEDHRAATDTAQDPKAENGYVRQDYTVALAKKAGFAFVGGSEVNANPKDTKHWVDGVWTLPPSLSQGDKDRAKYVAIGEADNYVLKFRKPQH